MLRNQSDALGQTKDYKSEVRWLCPKKQHTLDKPSLRGASMDYEKKNFLCFTDETDAEL